MIFCISEHNLAVHLTLEKQMNIAFPGKADPTMELHRSATTENGHIACFRLGHPRQFQRFTGVMIKSAGRVVCQRLGIINV